MAINTVARRDGSWMAVCLAPDVCLTPIGGTPVPVPYPVVAILGSAQATTPTVHVNGNEAFVQGGSFVPKTLGSEAGVQGGVKSGTTALCTGPQQNSSTVKFTGKPIVRGNDMVWMNGPPPG